MRCTAPVPVFFDRYFSELSKVLPRAEPSFAPALDVRVKGDSIVVRAELPGVDVKDVEVELHDDVLVLSGKKEQRKEEQDDADGARFSEFRYGSFQRAVELPAPVDPDSVQARCDKGVLTVELKKLSATRSRKIAIQAA